VTANRRSRILDRLALILIGIAVAGLLVRLTLKDALPIASTVYYTLPPIVVAGLLLGAGLSWRANRRSMRFAACCVAALVAAGSWFHIAYRHQPCTTPRGELRVLFWNAARGRGSWPGVADFASGFEADVIGLVEAGNASKGQQTFWRERFPDHDVYVPGRGLVILTRGRITDKRYHRLGTVSRCAVVEIDLDGRQLRVVVVDVAVALFSKRESVLNAAFGIAKMREDIPTIIMGDFNTPVDSVWFRHARESFTNTFEAAGAGLLVTWPLPLPVLALDHIWISRSLEVGCARLEWTWISDHRPVVAELSFAGE
jgi:endonuclease/exonuclease/phosphatase family metal-dependent hydrolase